MADFVSGDASTLLIECTNKDGSAINLAGATIKLHWKDESGTIQIKDMSIVDAAAGECSYKFSESELFPSGMDFEVKITDSQGNPFRNADLINVTVRAKLA